MLLSAVTTVSVEPALAELPLPLGAEHPTSVSARAERMAIPAGMPRRDLWRPRGIRDIQILLLMMTGWWGYLGLHWCGYLPRTIRRLMATMKTVVRSMAMEGKSTGHHFPTSTPGCSVEIIEPHSGVGGARPTPRKPSPATKDIEV